MLTAKQHKAHSYICEQLSRTGIAPSFAELQNYLGLASKSGVHAVLCGLEERGYVRRIKHRARAIQILKKPDGDMTIAAKIAASGLVSAAEAVAVHGADIGCLHEALNAYNEMHGRA